MKFLNEDTIEYMRAIWGFDTEETLDDINYFWSVGEYELVAKCLVDAGAVEPNCKEAKNMISVAKSIGPRKLSKMINEVFRLNPCTTLICKGCNAHHFLAHDHFSEQDIKYFKEHACYSCARGPIVDEETYYKRNTK